jgi:signal transduction histidine kinase
VVLTIFVTESLVMLLLRILPEQNYLVEALLDATLLVLVVYPALYLFFFKPMDMSITNAVKAKQAADEANAAKSLFLANISHELRTPMHAILSFSELGRDRAQTALPDKLRKYFERINSSGESLLALLNDLLDLSKLEAGKMVIEQSQEDLRSLATDVLMEFEPLINSKRLDVRLIPGESDTVAQVDRNRIGQVLRNLLSNALKFTPDGGRITLVLIAGELPAGRRTGDSGAIPAIVLEVSDTGVGIPQGELEAIFDHFVQSSRTRSSAGGTGLGLAICKEIVSAHRGELSAHNNAEGGATFVMKLPYIRPAASEKGSDAP